MMVVLFFALIAAAIWALTEYYEDIFVSRGYEDFFGLYLPLSTIGLIVGAILFGIGGYGTAKSIIMIIKFLQKREFKLNRAPKVLALGMVVLGVVAVQYYLPFWPLQLGLVRPTYGPYIAYYGDTGMAISWDTASLTTSDVQWGLAENNLVYSTYGSDNATQPSPSTATSYHHVVVLPNLTPGTTYYYRVPTLSQDVWHFRTAPSATSGESVVFTIVADTQGGYSVQKRNVALMIGDPDGIDFTAIAGDLCNRNDATGEWPELFARNSYGQIAMTTPWMNCPGNHETDCAIEGCGYRTYYKQYFQYEYPAGDSALPGAIDRGLYYSYNYSNVHIACVDFWENGTILTTTQLQWLKDDLARNEHMWKFLYFHLPVFSTADAGSDVLVANQILPITHEYNVSAVFYGHDHVFEAFAVNTTELFGGTYFFTVGGGGGSVDDMTNTVKYDGRAWPGPTLNVSINPAPYSGLLGYQYQVYGELTHHYLKVKVTGNDTVFTAIRSNDGATIFQRSIHRQWP